MDDAMRLVGVEPMRGSEEYLLRLEAENERLRRQNRELVTEIKVRDGLVSDLQNRLAALEDRWEFHQPPVEPRRKDRK